MILAGDIGGTKTNLALFERPMVAAYQASFVSAEYPGLVQVARAFLTQAAAAGFGRAPAAACFGIAGPVLGQRVETTSIPWVVVGRDVASELGIARVELLNDLAATGYGIRALDGRQLVVLKPGEAAPGANAVLIAAGTGLGEAVLVRRGEHFEPLPGEGGHVDFAPRDELEIELLRYLRQTWSHVSYERVVSGPGLLNIYRFLRQRGQHGPEPAWLAERMAAADPSAVISEAALAGESALCQAALELFVSLYGAEAGNLALKAVALGGVYVGGGIAPKIRRKLLEGGFIEGFTAKGRFRSLVERVPVYLILEPKTALLGAALRAFEAAERA